MHPQVREVTPVENIEHIVESVFKRVIMLDVGITRGISEVEFAILLKIQNDCSPL